MKRYFFYSCIVIWLLNIFDFYSTSIIIYMGGEELNPIADWCMKQVGIIGGLLILKIPFLCLLTYATYRICTKPSSVREKIALSSGYALIIAFYSYFMYFYNWPHIHDLLRGPVA